MTMKRRSALHEKNNGPSPMAAKVMALSQSDLAGAKRTVPFTGSVEASAMILSEPALSSMTIPVSDRKPGRPRSRERLASQSPVFSHLPVFSGAEDRVDDLHVLDRVLDAVGQPRLAEHGAGEGVRLLRILVDGGILSFDDAPPSLLAVVDDDLRRLHLRRVEGDQDLDAALGAAERHALMAAELRRDDEVELPAAAEIGDHRGQPVGAELGIAIDERRRRATAPPRR